MSDEYASLKNVAWQYRFAGWLVGIVIVGWGLFISYGIYRGLGPFTDEIGKVIGMQSNLFDENQRINEIEINFPNSYEYKIEVEIPKGFRVSDYSELNKLKEFISVDGSVSAKFNSKANINNNILYIDIEEFYKNLKYDKGRYQEFREVINTAAKFYNTSIVLEKI